MPTVTLSETMPIQAGQAGAMTEAEYRRDYELTRNEVATAIDSFYTLTEVHKYAEAERAVFDNLNNAASFWIVVLHGLQTTFFITLGRLFDEHSRSHSIHKLMNATTSHPEFFSKQALAERKRRMAGHDASDPEWPDWLADYLKTAWEPDVAALRELGRALKPSIKRFEALYEPIRHKVFAHKELKGGAQIEALFSAAIIQDIDDLLYSVHDVLEAIGRLYHNGIKPEVGVTKYHYQERNRDDTRKALSPYLHRMM